MSKGKGTKLSKKREFRKIQKVNKNTLNQDALLQKLPKCEPLQDCKRTDEMLTAVQYRTRGFGKRHYKQLVSFMIERRFPQNFINQIKVSFCKFKAMYTLNPMVKMDIIWIFKNLLTLDGQKLYNEFFDSILEVGYEYTISFIKRMGTYPEHTWRIVEYLRKVPADEWLPLTCFPSILFEKKRMNLAFEPLNGSYDLREVRETFHNYIYELDLKSLFVPPPDILYKVGNQLYNDDGVVRKDYEKPNHYRSTFKYQYFLASPLSPREVWLPDKFTKHNNLFWMLIGRQLLKKDPAYPSPDVYETWERARGKLLENIRFDVSGFGFQFPRIFLSLMASVIEELYPCDDIVNQSREFSDILDNVKVEVGWSIVEPPRGIGLGYYEDLKTLVMLAILKEYRPISVYGDQGLLPSDTAYMAIPRLIDYDFIIKFDKIEFSSHPEGMVKWAGHSMSNNALIRVKDITNPLIGSLFADTHWERKNALQSYYEDNKVFYKFHYKKIINLYRLIFGYELYDNDLSSTWTEGGINPFAPISVGESKVHIISQYMRPYEDTFFEAPYVTPFKQRGSKAYPRKIAKDFQKKRVDAFNRFKAIESSVYFYSRPRIEYNNKYKPKSRLIPDWADYLYLVTYGVTVGNFTFDLDTTQLRRIAQNYTFSADPLRAASRGGYKILDMYHSAYFPLGREWSLVLEFLETAGKRILPFVHRTDYPQNIMLQDTEMYYNTDLYSFIINDSLPQDKKRKRSIAFSESSLREAVKERLLENTLSNVGTGLIDNLSKTVNIVDTVEEQIVTEEDYIYDYENVDVFVEEIWEDEESP